MLKMKAVFDLKNFDINTFINELHLMMYTYFNTLLSIINTHNFTFH